MLKAEKKTGLDLGIKDLCIISGGKIYENPKIIRKYERQLVKLQRKSTVKKINAKTF